MATNFEDAALLSDGIAREKTENDLLCKSGPIQ